MSWERRFIHAKGMRRSLLLPLLFLASTVAEASPFLGFHPDAQEQLTPWGKSLHSLHLEDGQLYIGYGDYSANSGPIVVRRYDITTETFSSPLFTARTEAISQWRSINGQVFGVITDANFSPSQGGYFSGTEMNTWSETLVGPAIHSYDIASYEEALYLAGAGSLTASGHAGVYKSNDGGATWSLDLDVAPPSGGYGRFYGIHPLGSSLYAFLTETVDSTSVSSIYQHDGQRWSKVPSVADAATGVMLQGSSMMDLLSFAGVILGRNNHAGIAVGQLYAFDGSTWAEIAMPRSKTDQPIYTYDHTVANGAFYVLTSDFRIAKTTDLIHWSDVVTRVTSDARSLAVVDDCEIYVGGVDAGLYRYGSCTLEE